MSSCLSVCLSVCLCVCVSSTAQMAQPVLMKTHTNTLYDVCKCRFYLNFENPILMTSWRPFRIKPVWALSRLNFWCTKCSFYWGIVCYWNSARSINIFHPKSSKICFCMFKIIVGPLLVLGLQHVIFMTGEVICRVKWYSIQTCRFWDITNIISTISTFPFILNF